MSDRNLRLTFGLAYALCAIGFVMIGFSFVRNWFSDHRAPVVMVATETLNSPFEEGGQVKVRIYREKVRDDCPVISNRRAKNQTTGENYDIPNAHWAGGPANDTFIDMEYDTSHLPPGDYVLFVNLTYQCPEFLHDVEQPVTFFRIEAANAAN